MNNAIVSPAQNLPGWNWNDFDDGSGFLKSPFGNIYFNYYMSPYCVLSGIEYEMPNGYFYIYYGNLNGFKLYAEELIMKRGLNL